jgi:hypothetical protein
MIALRDAVLTATILALIFIADNLPRPVKDNQVPYCMIDYQASVRHPLTGEKVTIWTRGYGLCSAQDKFFEI